MPFRSAERSKSSKLPATTASSSSIESATATDRKGKKMVRSRSLADKKGKGKAVITSDDDDNYFDDDRFPIDDEFEDEEDFSYPDNTSIDLDLMDTSDPQLSDLGLRSDASALSDIGNISYDVIRTKRDRRRIFRRHERDEDDAVASNTR